MRKMLLKKLLNILDSIELQGIDLHDAKIQVYEILTNDYYSLSYQEVCRILDFLKEYSLIHETIHGIDLNPAPTIYAKCNQNSDLEALALFESFINNENCFTFFKKQLKKNEWITKDFMESKLDYNLFHLFIQTTMFETENEIYRIRPVLLDQLHSIMVEYSENPKLLISITLEALYTSAIVRHEDMRIDYKNTHLPMTKYKHLSTILSIIPRKGIPHDRDETKALQTFYKDTLFNEFEHACPLCGIQIPHMLIASHIKPFRDCAHIFEAIDHNNGLLLCRNHDYLFDQGYFTFDQRGYIILSQKLLKYDDLDAYVIKKNYKLPSSYLTDERLQFLDYHRKHIFIDSDSHKDK